MENILHHPRTRRTAQRCIQGAECQSGGEAPPPSVSCPPRSHSCIRARGSKPATVSGWPLWGAFCCGPGDSEQPNQLLLQTSNHSNHSVHWNQCYCHQSMPKPMPRSLRERQIGVEPSTSRTLEHLPVDPRQMGRAIQLVCSVTYLAHAH